MEILGQSLTPKKSMSGWEFQWTIKCQDISSGGSIAMESVLGKFEARTSGGSTKSKLTQRSNKSVVMETSGGFISLILPEGWGAGLSAKTSGGCVSCQLPFTGKSYEIKYGGNHHPGRPRGPIERFRRFDCCSFGVAHVIESFEAVLYVTLDPLFTNGIWNLKSAHE